MTLATLGVHAHDLFGPWKGGLGAETVGRLGGLKGGAAQAASLSKTKRAAIAKKAAGLTERLWEMSGIAALTDKAAGPPKPRGPYPARRGLGC